MTTRRNAPLVLIGLFLVLAPAPAQAPDPTGFVRDLYLRYAGVEPTPQMIDFWVKELRKGVQPNEVIANVLGSEQAFVRSRRNNEVWVANLYADLLGRAPEPGAARHWLDRLRELRDDRVKLARDFLQAAGAEIGAGGIRPPAAIPPAELPAHLLATANVLLQSSQEELAGRDGWLLREQARAYTVAVTGSKRILENPAQHPKRYAETLASIDTTLTQFRAALGQSRLPAPNTRLHAEQSAQLLALMVRNAGVIPPVGPPGVPGSVSREDARRLAPYLTDLDKEMTAANATFQAILRQSWNGREVLNQVQAIATEADSLRSDVRGGYPLNDLLVRARGLTQAAEQVSAIVAKGGVDVRLYQSWYKATASLNSFTAQLTTGPIGPPPIPGGGVNVPRETFRAIDAAVLQCDALVIAYTQYTFFNRPAAKLVADLQELKNRYARLRQEVTTPTSPRELKAHLDGIADRLRSASQNWREADRDPRLKNPPDLNDLNAADREVTRLISSAR